MNTQQVSTVAPSQDVMNERWKHLTEAVDGIARQIPLMATRAYLDEKLDAIAQKMVARGEFDRQTWELEQVKRDLERLAKETDEKIQENSPKRLWGNITSIIGGLTGIVALLVALGVFKRP
jgi:hypothetical protein